MKLAMLVFALAGCSGCYTTTSSDYGMQAPMAQAPAGEVVINGQTLTAADAQAARIPGGRYWYDARSGLWGLEGNPVQGQIQPGMPFGELAADASRGTTNVFVNGRNLPVVEVLFLQNLLQTAVMQGRYWLDAQGNVGVEGGPAMVNLYAVARSRGGGGGDNFWSSATARGNESNGAGYVCVNGGTCATYGM